MNPFLTNPRYKDAYIDTDGVNTEQEMARTSKLGELKLKNAIQKFIGPAPKLYSMHKSGKTIIFFHIHNSKGISKQKEGQNKVILGKILGTYLHRWTLGFTFLFRITTLQDGLIDKRTQLYFICITDHATF